MIPRLGAKYDIQIETISKPREFYVTDSYKKSRQPVAPAVMVDDVVIVEKKDISEEKLESIICRKLGNPEPKKSKDGILDRLFKHRKEKKKE